MTHVGTVEKYVNSSLKNHWTVTVDIMRSKITVDSRVAYVLVSIFQISSLYFRLKGAKTGRRGFLNLKIEGE